MVISEEKRVESQQPLPSEHSCQPQMTGVRGSHMKPPPQTPPVQGRAGRGAQDPWHLLHPAAPSFQSHPPCLDSPLPALGLFPLLLQLLLPPSAGYQGSFHSIQNCFPYGDCYRTAEPAASGDGLAEEPHSFNPLRPNGYHSLSVPLPATGKPPPHASLP